LVHEALRRQNYAGVPAREIADKLAQRLRNAWDVERHIDLEISGASLILDERRGFALALILNELLTNALRHAFPNGREGTIRLRFEHEQRELRMVVEDDGVGSSMERMSGVTGSGMSIVTALVRNELDGEVRWDATPGGTNVVVAFPESPDSEPGADEPVGAASGGAVG
jgi:two-component sensor histidine kinase